MISEINTVHAAGFSLTGTTGANFFTGTDAGDIAVNSSLMGNPQLVQASSSASAQGNNQVALQLAQIADKKHASLSGQTFSQNFNGIVADLGQALANVNGQKETQEVVESMLLRQRDSLMGVSVDEEMTDLIKYQKAYQPPPRSSPPSTR
jgi:flagellar hook-associated protein 1 FlgK